MKKDYDNFFILIVAIMPLFVPFFIYRYFNDYITLPKIVFTSLCCIFILFVSITTYKSNLVFKIFNEQRPKLPLLLILLFYSFIVISTFLSIAPFQSIIGANKRYEGLIAWTNYILIFLVIASSYKFHKKHLYYIGVSAAILCIHSILFCFDIHIIPKYIELSRSSSVASNWSLVGNQNFFGSYITVIFPMFIYAYVKEGNKFYLFVDLLLFGALTCSLTRSAYLAAFFYIIFFTVYFIIKKSFKRITILLVCFLFIFISINSIKNHYISTKLTSIPKEAFSLVESKNIKLGSNRIFIWSQGIKLIPKYVLHGSGPDTFGIAFHSNFQKQVNDSGFKMFYFDKAHNEYLQIAVTMGIPALLLYLCFISVLLYYSLISIKYNEHIIPLIITLISYLIQAFFNISVVTVAPLYFVLLGIIYSNIKISKNSTL